jgi:predicted MFS family arabinose efflux permease
MAVFLVLMTQISSTEQLWWMRSLMFCIGLCIGPVFISTQASAFTQISHAHTSHASSLYNSQRQMGSAMGVAVMAMVLNAVGTIKLVGGVPEANLAAYHAAFVVAGAVALVASAVSLGIHDGDAAATMIRKPART